MKLSQLKLDDELVNSSERTLREVLPADGPRPRLVLTLDGGGMRGFFQAKVLERLLPCLGRQGEGAFDLIAGTSTGGITALALAVPEMSGRHRTPAGIASFYQTHGPRIFPASSYRKLSQWVRSKHHRGPLDRALRDAFGDQLFSAADMRVVVPAYDAADHTMTWFDSAALRDQTVRNHWRSLTGKPPLLDPPAWQVAAATAAAPTYFDPVRAHGRVWLDGGLGANDPTPVAMALAHADLSQTRKNLSSADRLRSVHTYPKIWVLSIGTGRTPPNSRWRRGRLGFAFGLPHAFMYPSALTAEFAVQSMADVQEITANNQFGRVFSVLRVDPPESMAQLPLDAATPAAFDEMERGVDEALADTSFIIDFAMFAAASRL